MTVSIGCDDNNNDNNNRRQREKLSYITSRPRYRRRRLSPSGWPRFRFSSLLDRRSSTAAAVVRAIVSRCCIQRRDGSVGRR